MTGRRKDRKTERQKDRKTERQKDRTTARRQKGRQTERNSFLFVPLSLLTINTLFLLSK